MQYRQSHYIITVFPQVKGDEEEDGTLELQQTAIPGQT